MSIDQACAEKILELAGRIGVLDARFNLASNPHIEILQDLEVALFLSGRTAGREHVASHAGSHVSVDWTELREHIGALLGGAFEENFRAEFSQRMDYFEVRQERRDEHGKLLRRIEDVVDEKFPIDSMDAAEDAYTDMGILLLHCYLKGTIESRFCGLLQFAYMGGAWPCGWRGQKSDGKMIVYQIPRISKN